MATTTATTDLYRSATQGVKVRGVMLFSLLVLLGTAYAGYQIGTTFGLSPADGGQLKPAWERWSLALFLLAMAVAFVAGMLVYGERYVDRIGLNEASGQFLLHTLGPLAKTYVLAQDDVIRAEQRRDKSEPWAPWNDGISIDAPWLSLRIKGRDSFLILDQQGWFTPVPELQSRIAGLLGYPMPKKAR